MSFITYLCWLLGISVPADCDANGYQQWTMDPCTVDETNVDAPKDEGQNNAPPRHRSTNISVSI